MKASLRLSPPLEALAQKIASVISAQAYVVGGTLRDALLGRPTRDLDLAIEGAPDAVGPEMARHLGGRYFPLGKEGIGRIVVPSSPGALQIDLHPLAGPIEDDLRARDYTIDAMAVSLAEAMAGQARIIDPLGGLRDLEEGLVRLTGHEALHRDPIRLLRGVRLACELGFHLEEDTASLLAAHRRLLPQAAPERQREELMRLLATDRAGEGLRLMDHLGLLTVLLPELEAARGFPQPPEHHWDVLGHLLATVSWLDLLLARERPQAQAYLWEGLWQALGPLQEEVRRYLEEEVAPGHPRRALLKLGGLLHDVAKPHTRTMDAQGRIRFFGHERKGAEMAAAAMARLRFSRREGELVATWVRAHLRPMHMSQGGLPTPRAIYRFFRDCGEAAMGVLLLTLADHLATVGPRLRLEGWLSHVHLVHYVLSEAARRRELVAPPRLITGHDVMEALGIHPGPLVGRLLRAVEEAQAAGEVRTREEALALVRRLGARWAGSGQEA